jgi:hypothetical protein
VLPTLLAAGWLALALGVLASAGVLQVKGGSAVPAPLLWVTLGLVGGPGLTASAMRLARTAPIDAAALSGLDTGVGRMPTWLVSRFLSVLLGVIGIFPALGAVIEAFGGIRAPHGQHLGAGLAPGTVAVQAVLSAALLCLYLLAAGS